MNFSSPGLDGFTWEKFIKFKMRNVYGDVIISLKYRFLMTLI